jgi:hypothetical protein
VIAGLLREGYLAIAPKKLRDVAEGRAARRRPH